MAELNDSINQIVSMYETFFPNESAGLAGLHGLVDSGANLDNSRTLPGHITASGLVLSPDKTKLLLIQHISLNKWLQPGGHMEVDDITPLVTARREVVEETAASIGQYIQFDPQNKLVPLDIDSHAIPPSTSKDMPAHTHHDMRYVFVAAHEALVHQAGEVSAAVWVSGTDQRLDGLGRVKQKLLQYGFLRLT